RILLISATSPENATFSYQHAWPRQFAAHGRFAVASIDLGRLGLPGRVAALVAVKQWRGDAIVLLHSVFSNEQNLGGRLFDAVARRPEPKAFFIGNEYKSMPEKMQFAEGLGVSLLVSQSSSPAVHALYRERLGCAVTGIPNTGLDTEIFGPQWRTADRPIDLGYRAHVSPAYLGHNERVEIAGYFREHATRWGLAGDISRERGARVGERGGGGVLNQCKGQFGRGAGGGVCELTELTRWGGEGV